MHLPRTSSSGEDQALHDLTEFAVAAFSLHRVPPLSTSHVPRPCSASSINAYIWCSLHSASVNQASNNVTHYQRLCTGSELASNHTDYQASSGVSPVC